MPANRRALHWAQAKVYGALLCAERGLASLSVALVYYGVASTDETLLVARCSAASLQAFYVDQCERFLAWARQEAAHRAASAGSPRASTAPRSPGARCSRRRPPASARPSARSIRS